MRVFHACLVTLAKATLLPCPLHPTSPGHESKLVSDVKTLPHAVSRVLACCQSLLQVGAGVWMHLSCWSFWCVVAWQSLLPEPAAGVLLREGGWHLAGTLAARVGSGWHELPEPAAGALHVG